MNFGTMLKEYRKLNGLSQNDLAQKVNITYQSISKYENNQRIPPLDIALSIASKLDLSLDSLKEDYDEEKNAKENEIIIAFRNKPDMQKAVCKLLDVEDCAGNLKVYMAARSDDNISPEMIDISEKEKEALINAPESDKKI